MRIKLVSMSLLVMLISCGRFGNADHKGDHDVRIVCIAKQYSEIACALNAQEDIVAVDVSSTYPDELKKLPTVGYHRALSAEAILAMKPTLILQQEIKMPVRKLWVITGDKYEVLTKDMMKAAYQLEPVIHIADENMYLFFT